MKNSTRMNSIANLQSGDTRKRDLTKQEKAELSAFREGLEFLGTKSESEVFKMLGLTKDGKYKRLWQNIMVEMLHTTNPKRHGHSKYKPLYSLLLVHHMMKGSSFLSFGSVIGSPYERIKEWTKRHPEFALAREIGESFMRDKWEKIAQDTSSGAVKGNAATIIFALKNYFPDEYKDKRELEHSGHVYMVDTGIDRDDSNAIDAEFREAEQGQLDSPDTNVEADTNVETDDWY